MIVGDELRVSLQLPLPVVRFQSRLINARGCFGEPHGATGEQRHGREHGQQGYREAVHQGY
jgi:hypothetical protein